MDLVFLVDMILTFHTSYRTRKSEGSKLVKRLHLIRKHYMRGWFFLDLLSIIPWELIGEVITRSAEEEPVDDQYDDDEGAHHGVGFLKLARLFRILRMLKLLRLIKASR